MKYLAFVLFIIGFLLSTTVQAIPAVSQEHRPLPTESEGKRLTELNENELSIVESFFVSVYDAYIQIGAPCIIGKIEFSYKTLGQKVVTETERRPFVTLRCTDSSQFTKEKILEIIHRIELFDHMWYQNDIVIGKIRFLNVHYEKKTFNEDEIAEYKQYNQAVTIIPEKVVIDYMDDL